MAEQSKLPASRSPRRPAFSIGIQSNPSGVNSIACLMTFRRAEASLIFNRSTG